MEYFKKVREDDDGNLVPFMTKEIKIDATNISYENALHPNILSVKDGLDFLVEGNRSDDVFLYVSKDGSEAGDGTMERPFLKIQQAIDYIKKMFMEIARKKY